MGFGLEFQSNLSVFVFGLLIRGPSNRRPPHIETSSVA